MRAIVRGKGIISEFCFFIIETYRLRYAAESVRLPVVHHQPQTEFIRQPLPLTALHLVDGEGLDFASLLILERHTRVSQFQSTALLQTMNVM